MHELNPMERYTCSRCMGVTLAPPGRVAVTCSHCGIVDLGTEVARQRWRTVAEVHLANRPSLEPARFTRPRWMLALVSGSVAACFLVGFVGWLVLR
jgi:hypothetical protein